MDFRFVYNKAEYVSYDSLGAYFYTDGSMNKGNERVYTTEETITPLLHHGKRVFVNIEIEHFISVNFVPKWKDHILQSVRFEIRG